MISLISRTYRISFPQQISEVELTKKTSKLHHNYLQQGSTDWIRSVFSPLRKVVISLWCCEVELFMVLLCGSTITCDSYMWLLLVLCHELCGTLSSWLLPTTLVIDCGKFVHPCVITYGDWCCSFSMHVLP